MLPPKRRHATPPILEVRTPIASLYYKQREKNIYVSNMGSGKC
jgi:hypothetical protein